MFNDDINIVDLEKAVTSIDEAIDSLCSRVYPWRPFLTSLSHVNEEEEVCDDGGKKSCGRCYSPSFFFSAPRLSLLPRSNQLSSAHFAVDQKSESTAVVNQGLFELLECFLQ